MKYFLLSVLTFACCAIHAQKVESIYVNLYTDSLKKGTANYINIDGKLPNGRYLPLDTTHLIFSASDGKFIGNCLWLDPAFAGDKVNIKVILKNDPAIFKQFDIYVKRNADNEQLKTVDELMGEMKNKQKQRKKNR